MAAAVLPKKTGPPWILGSQMGAGILLLALCGELGLMGVGFEGRVVMTKATLQCMVVMMQKTMW